MIAPLIALAAAYATGYGTGNFDPTTDGPPPVRYQHNVMTTVSFVDEPVIASKCGNPGAAGYMGCTTDWNHVWITNPCLVHESYAETLCHELAHVNGWPENHPR